MELPLDLEVIDTLPVIIPATRAVNLLINNNERGRCYYTLSAHTDRLGNFSYEGAVTIV
jgi:hypothetical protein